MGTDRVESPNEYPDNAWEEPGPGGLTADQLAARISTKIEEAAQERGLIQPPGPDPEPEEGEHSNADDDVDALDDEAQAEVEPEGEQEEVDAAAGEQGEVVAEDEAVEFFLDAGSTRYKSLEDAVAGTREKDETIQRLYRQLNELQQDRQTQEEDDQQPVALDTSAWDEWAEEAVSNGTGAQGAVQALQEGGRDGYNLYLRHWLADEDQRADALAFHSEMLLELAEQRARQAVQPIVSDRQASAAEAQAAEAKRQVASKYDDFGEYEEKMNELIGSLADPEAKMLADLAVSSPQGRQLAWEQLYLRAKVESQPTRARATTEEKKRRKASGDAAKVAATVSTSEGSASRTPASQAETEALQIKNSIRAEAGLPLIETD